MSKKIILSTALLAVNIGITSQNVGINTTGVNPHASAMLDVNSNNKGLLIPNISLTGKTSNGPIPSPATSLLVYNITIAGSGANQVTPGYHYWDGSQWIRIFDDNVNASDHDWYEVGGTSSPNNIGDDLFTNGDVGIGTATPDSKLHVAGDIRIGEISPQNSGSFPSYGDQLYFSGSSAGASFNSDNSDPLWMSRYNVLADQSEIRINLGDNIQAQDKFHIGTTTGGIFVTHVAVTAEGRLGIQTDAPATELHVVGNERIEGNYIEIGAGLTGNRNAYTDYVGDDTYTDFGFRIIRANTGPNSYTQLTHRGTGALYIGAQDAGSVQFRTNNIDRMTILPTSGNVGIGLTNPEEQLVINGITRLGGQVTDDDPDQRIHLEICSGAIGNDAAEVGPDRAYRLLTEINYISVNRDWMIFEALDGNQLYSDGGFEFRTRGSTGAAIPLMTMDGDGQIGMGTNVPAYQLQLGTNSAAKPTSSSWTVASDARLKTDVQTFEGGLDVLMQINPVWFTYNGKAGMPLETGIGTIAQELQKIAPYMVTSWEYFDIEKQTSTEYLGVDYGAMDFLLINAIKEQQTEIDTLKNDILELKSMLLELSK
ncbi:MAG: hypothetical protein ACI9N1_001187 [Flavobacteriales bacterium]|jgi:hypothetical protein